jgi:hypothetical protein
VFGSPTIRETAGIEDLRERPRVGRIHNICDPLATEPLRSGNDRRERVSDQERAIEARPVAPKDSPRPWLVRIEQPSRPDFPESAIAEPITPRAWCSRWRTAEEVDIHVLAQRTNDGQGARAPWRERISRVV